ncbi:hypothetical protein GW17_00032058 [Ensete ventricosum]|nr:hypothetical protein GW17_00032058 [Ensete ventricosum]
MVNQMKLFRNAGQSQRFRFVVLVVGCFLVSMTFVVVSRPLTFFPSLSSRLRPQKSDAEREKAADTSSYSAPSTGEQPSCCFGLVNAQLA